MDQLAYIVGWLFVATIAGLLGLIVAKSRAISPTFGFVVCFLFPVMVPVLFLLGRSTKRQCPFCEARVSDTAAVCRHCGRDLPARSAAVAR